MPIIQSRFAALNSKLDKTEIYVKLIFWKQFAVEQKSWRTQSLLNKFLDLNAFWRNFRIIMSWLVCFRAIRRCQLTFLCSNAISTQFIVCYIEGSQWGSSILRSRLKFFLPYFNDGIGKRESFSMLRVSVNRDVNGINSVFSALLLSMFCVFHRITSSIQLRRAMAINYVLKRGDAKGEK